MCEKGITGNGMNCYKNHVAIRLQLKMKLLHELCMHYHIGDGAETVWVISGYLVKSCTG